MSVGKAAHTANNSQFINTDTSKNIPKKLNITRPYFDTFVHFHERIVISVEIGFVIYIDLSKL